MENFLSIQSVLERKGSYNLAIPFVQSQQINPYYKLNVSLLEVDTTPNAAQIFKVGSKSLGNNQWEDLYSLAKPFLQILATGAGIQFAPGAGDVVKVDGNTWKASAFGALRLPDGSVRTSNNFKVIDLLTEESKYRLAYKEKAANGISDKRAAKVISEKYTGTWNGSMYIIAEQDRAKYIESSLLDAMAQLRANAPQKAATGAMLRVIRDLLGIKGTYTMAELKKPFAVARMSFSPDYNDPLVKQMLLQQCMQSVGNLFGNVQSVMQTIAIPQSADDEIDMPVDITLEPVHEQSRKAQPQSVPQSPKKLSEPQVQPAQSKVMTEEDRAQDFCCDKCGKVIPEKVWHYSYENMGRPLCFNCQKIVEREENK